MTGGTDLISTLLACLLYCTTKGFFSRVGVSLPEWGLSLVVAMVDKSLGDEMSILICSAYEAGGGMLLFSLSQARKYLTLPVDLQYLRYQIMLTITIITIVPSIVIIINNELGIMKRIFSIHLINIFITC